MRKYKNVILAAILSLVFISCTDTVENDSGNSSEPSKENQQTEYTVHFCCNEIANWDEVYVYSWEDSDSNAEWPGIKMSVAESGIYKASVKQSNVIFTDGNGKQTADLKTQNGYFTPTGTDSKGQVTGLWSTTKPENGSGEEEKPSKLETPIVTAMYDKSSKKIILVWSIVQDADSYEIYYNTTNNFNEEKTVGDTTETSCTITEIKTNKITYYFWVRAKTAEGLKSDLSNSVSCYVENEEESEETLAAPSYLNATAMSESSVSLNWENVTGATYYLVYYSRYNSVSYETDYVIAYKNYITIPQLISGTAYYFWVKASNGTTQSTYSPYAAAMTKDKQEVIVDLTQPRVMQSYAPITDDCKGLVVKIANDEKYVDSRTQKYRLYRSESQYDGYEQVKESSASDFSFVFEDKNVTMSDNKIYYYKVSAVYGSSETFSSNGAKIVIQPPKVLAVNNKKAWTGYISFNHGHTFYDVKLERKAESYPLSNFSSGKYPISIQKIEPLNDGWTDYNFYEFKPLMEYKINVSTGKVTSSKTKGTDVLSLFNF